MFVLLLASLGRGGWGGGEGMGVGGAHRVLFVPVCSRAAVLSLAIL